MDVYISTGISNLHLCLQIMPQMLNHLKIDSKTSDSLDWGVLLVYTCWCDAPTAYTQEQIFRQHYSVDGHELPQANELLQQSNN